MSTSAVLLVPANRHLFAITFGFGRLLLLPGVADDRFGLRVTLNAVDHTQIRSVDRLTLDSPAPHSQIQASRAANIGEFGLNVDQDLLRAVTGNPRDTTLGKRLTGKDALRTTGPFTLPELPALLRRFLAESKKPTTGITSPGSITSRKSKAHHCVKRLMALFRSGSVAKNSMGCGWPFPNAWIGRTLRRSRTAQHPAQNTTRTSTCARS